MRFFRKRPAPVPREITDLMRDAALAEREAVIRYLLGPDGDAGWARDDLQTIYRILADTIRKNDHGGLQ